MKKLASLVLALMLVLSVCSFAGAEDDVIKLTWAMGTGSTAPKDNAMVLEELNKISREKLGVEVDIQYFTNDQLQNSIQSGEVFDMYFTCSWYNNFNVAVSNKLFANIWPHLQEWTPDLYATMPENVWELAKSSDGGLYAIPVKKDYCPENFIVYPADKAAELGFEIPANIEAWDDLTDFLVAWKETLPENEYPVMVGGNPPGMETSFDFIDRTVQIGVLFGTTEVVTVYEDPKVMERYHTMNKWYNLGLINPDAAQLTEDAIDDKHQHLNFVQAWDGYDYSVGYGYNCEMTRYSGPFLSTDGVQGSMNAFSITLENDLERFEAAMKYQELVNTDKLYRDTLRYGVQGYHWNYVTEEQSAACAGGVLRTQVGTDNYNPWAFSQGSYSLASIAVSQAQVDGTAKAPVMNQWDLYFANCENAEVSAISGFTFDSSKWKANYAEITAIKDQYYKNYASGTINIDDVYDEMMEKMNAAGLQDIIEDAQAQLDAYLASK